MTFRLGAEERKNENKTMNTNQIIILIIICGIMGLLLGAISGLHQSNQEFSLDNYKLEQKLVNTQKQLELQNRKLRKCKSDLWDFKENKICYDMLTDEEFNKMIEQIEND